MKTRTTMLLAMALGVAIGGLPARANMVLNGDFENPTVTTSPHFVPSGSSAVVGWTIGGGSGVTIDHIMVNRPYWPANQTQWMDLTGNSGGAWISQAIATTVGMDYRLTFDTFNGSNLYSGNKPRQDGFSVEATGSSPLVVSVTPGTGAFIAYNFKATSATTTLKFLELTGFDSNAGWIDNVQLTAVPEASTYLAGIGALAILALSAWNRHGQHRALPK